MRWSDAKRILQQKDRSDLFRFIKSLYDLSKANKTFFEAALTSCASSTISKYKGEIADAVNPDVFAPIELKRGRKAISDYRRAVPSDIYGQVDLMLYFVECGTNQTLEYGDIDGPFYDSMCCMVDSVLKAAPKLTDSEHSRIVDRFIALDVRTRNKIGWGYSDHIEAAADEIVHQKPTKR